MESRRLGRTGLTVGAAGVHTSWRERDAEAGRRALTWAMERGVDVVVVDPVHARAIERIVGEVVRDLKLRDRAVIATRIDAPMHPRAIQAQLEDSLRATRLEVIPIALVGWDDRNFYERSWPETLGGLERLVREGKALRWGLSPGPKVALDEIRLGISESIFEVVAFPYDLLSRAHVDALLDSAKRHDVGAIVTSPLHHGLLGGGWTRDTTFAPGDWRADTYAPAELAPHLAKVAKLAPLATRETDSLAELALRFALHRPEVSVVAPSIRTPEQADALLRAADGRRLGDSLLQRLDEALS